MKKILQLLLILGLPVVALAQMNTLTTTTLSSAIAAGTPGTNATCFQVASATGINAPSLTNGTQGSTLLVWPNEAIQVQTVSSTTVCGWRGQAGTKVVGHQTGALVIIGNPDWYSNAAAGTVPSGTCTQTALYAYPDIHLLDNTWYGCDSLGLWGYAGPGIGHPSTRNAVTQVSATYTAKYWDQTIEATANSFTITLPAASAMPGKVYVLSNTSSGTITVTTAHGCATYTTAGCTVYSNGTVWQTF